MSELPRRRFAEGTTAEDLKAYHVPFVERLGYKLNTDSDFVDMVYEGELEILDRDGDVYCPCRVRTGDATQDNKIICPCIPFYSDQFAALRKCWCGLFIRSDVADGSELMGVIEAAAGPVDVPLVRETDMCDGAVRRFHIGKRDIALVRTEGEYYALSNVCRHAFGPLSEGFLDGYFLMCPWHGWRYDVRDGSTDHPSSDVTTFPVTVKDGYVLVTIDYKP